MDGKTCTKCGEWKPLDDFYASRDGRRGRQSSCIPCFKKRDFVYRNRPEQLAMRPERARRFREKRPFWARAHHANTRAVRYGVPGTITEQNLADLWEDQEGACYYCRQPLDDTYVGEHKTPLSRGGDNALGNICLACQSCNLAKGSRTEEEFYRFRVMQKAVDNPPSQPQWLMDALIQRRYRRFMDIISSPPDDATIRGRKWIDFNAARTIVRSCHFPHSSEYYLWVQLNPAFADFPLLPDASYPDEWRGWDDFLGTEPLIYPTKEAV